jgi:hypothetical protein
MCRTSTDRSARTRKLLLGARHQPPSRLLRSSNLALRAAMLLLVIFSVSPTSATGSDTSPVIAGAIEKLRQRDKAITSYTCESQLRVRELSQLTGQYWEYALATKVKIDRITHQFLIKNTGRRISPPAPFKNNKEYLSEFEEVVGFDGVHTRIYLKSEAFDPKTGQKSPNPLEQANVSKGSQPRYSIDPENFLGRYAGRSIAESLEEGPTEIQTIAGGMIQLTCTFTKDVATNAYYRLVFELDGKKGMAPVRVEDLTRFDGSEKWATAHELKLGDYTEVKPGLWLPQSFDDTHQIIERDKEPVLLTNKTGSMSFSLVNVKYPDNFPQVAFPAGIIVVDESDHDN